MKKQYKHLFFDLDHTLWDFDKNSRYTLEKLYQEYELEQRGIYDFEEFFTKYNAHNDKLWDKFRKGHIKRDELRWKRLWLTLIDYKIGDTALAHEMSSAYLEILPVQKELTPYAKEVLDHCKDKYQIHIITNGFHATQKLKLQYSGISSYFSEIISSEGSNSMKPRPEIYEFALNATGATEEDSIMIGDALEVDVKGAANAGWDQVYYNPHQIEHNSQPTYEITSLKELLTIF
ncbi:MAG: YjjG family noncanonical pyrimidine nucleotidase [Flavipsychrobacter sp.]